MAIAAVRALIPQDEPERVTLGEPVVSTTLIRMSEFAPTASPGFNEVSTSGAAETPGPAFRLAAAGPTSVPTGSEAPPPATDPDPGSTNPSTDPPGTISPPSGPTTPPDVPVPDDPGDVPEPGIEPVDPALPAPYVADVLELVELSGFTLEDPPQDDDGTGLTQLMATASSVDENGDRVPPEVAARRIVAVLARVRTEDVDGLKEPLGVIVRVRVRIEHAEGVPVQISWEMDGVGDQGQRLTHRWLRGQPAYEVEAANGDDRGVVRLWVPLPPARGRYSLTLSAGVEGDQLAQDSQTIRELPRR